jgi:uncharacterized protein
MTKQRVEVLDTLRAFALLGVVVVNSASFVYAWSAPVAGAVDPPGSALAALVHGVIVALFQNKSYPLLAFLVGYGIALQLRNYTPQTVARRKRVAYTLLALGLAHGLLLYFGDILFAYGLMSLILIWAARVRLRILWRWCKGLAAYVVLITALYSTFSLDAPQAVLRDATTWAEVMEINASTYAWVLFAMPFDLLPVVLTFGLAGLIAGRLRWLEDARRWAPQWQRMVRIALPWGLVLNLLNGVVCAALAYHGHYYNVFQQSVPTLIGPLMAAGWVAWVALSSQRGVPWLHTLAPLGRYTLSMYLGTSLLLVLALPAAGLGLSMHVGTVGTFVGALAAYALWLVVARSMARRGLRGPIERLLR